MSKAYYIDTFSNNTDHEMYNASSLKMFACLYDEIIYCADQSAMRNLKRMLKGFPSNVSYQKIKVPQSNSSFMRFLKQLLAIFNNCKIIITARKNDTIIINYNTMISIYPVNYITALFDKKVLIICHGEMMDLTVKRRTSWLFSKSKAFFTSSKVKIAKKLYFSVLGDPILENLEPYLSPKVFKKMITFEHSAIFNSFDGIQDKENKKLKVGAIGIFRESKGLTDFLNLGENLKPYSDKIEISAIGRIRVKKKLFRDAGIKFYDEFCERFLSRQEMYQLISDLDLVLFLYPKESYKFTASGTLFDAIDCEKPILALDNDYFSHIYHTYGAFGKLVHSNVDFKEELVKLASEGVYDVDLKGIKIALDPEKVALKLREKLKKVDLL